MNESHGKHKTQPFEAGLIFIHSYKQKGPNNLILNQVLVNWVIKLLLYY